MRVGGQFTRGLWVLLALVLAPVSAMAGPFSNWAVVVISGDYHAHGDVETDAFDNARRDVSAALVARGGFSATNIRQFSARPEHFDAPRPGSDSFDEIVTVLHQLTRTATAGCLIYISSHGAPYGVQLGQTILPPAELANALGGACGQRPTIIVVSACFSGVFVPMLAGANRMILTAARPDRTSFGCGVDNTYPYFDDCFLQSIAISSNFIDLGPRVVSCVAARETSEGMAPPSEPQVWIDPEFTPLLQRSRFGAPPGRRRR